MQAKDFAAIAYSAESQVLTVSVLKNGAMSILQALADLGIISISLDLRINRIINFAIVCRHFQLVSNTNQLLFPALFLKFYILFLCSPKGLSLLC
jgi:hypothetical protein